MVVVYRPFHITGASLTQFYDVSIERSPLTKAIGSKPLQNSVGMSS
ncbi:MULTISPECIES: hypothetical protein [Nostoc]|uniref:Uncharacterized protein n=1 Tax=Nostoc paludosum FACHB-159 TaxID=2692908 RepID=A0ABR8KJ19_9NOSO|nr:MULTISPECIES: hypothetical protein [Nostoc]MBD2682343.1 hypothetical protein [Nostoc sp. FACHB-857]MBD2738714.1 hypothetical protein [Nostoc paludosum FACHB-159]